MNLNDVIVGIGFQCLVFLCQFAYICLAFVRLAQIIDVFRINMISLRFF